MSEQDWTFKPAAPVEPTAVEPGTYSVEVEGLTAAVEIARSYLTWSVDGFLGDLPVRARDMTFRQTPEAVAEAQAKAVAAARRLYAAGVRGEISYPVSCCDRLLPTPADAERHEQEHMADIAQGTVIHVTAQVEIEDGQEGRYVIGLGPIEDSPWWVVNRPGNVSVYSFLHREDAVNFADALNRGDIDTASRIREEGRLPVPEVDGPQHERFEDTLPVAAEGSTR